MKVISNDILNTVEMRMRRCTNDHTLTDRIRNQSIRGKLEVVLIEEKMRENCLRWFGRAMHTNRFPVRRSDKMIDNGVARTRGRPIQTWIKVLKNDIIFC